MNCTKDSEVHVTCVVSGCPRVDGDYVVDKLHYRINGGGQVEPSFKCINGETARVGFDNNNQPFDLGVQACRHRDLSENPCTPWSNFRYTPPAAAEVKCGPNDQTPTVPAGSKCVPKTQPPVQCPAGSATPTVPAGAQCAPAALKTCPPGSAKAQVPGSESCAPPANAVTMNIGGGALTRTVSVTNNSALAASCAYDAKGTGGVFAPGLNRQINVGPNGSTSIDVPAPPLGSTYQVTLTCTGNWDGKQVEIGRVVQNVSSF
ncbi:hypothetical protein [Mycobacterium deserti]|uniref:Uncharacterized protein n=1 Tax=Mycobacterium deserti TaxID=2978347 RepID=A0ABT2M4W8_9MYCO|nr:hypothetical protein [Mycobacterium deserti]MCT7657299.1 hypothetical protein [Mycobacterium deserti]